MLLWTPNLMMDGITGPNTLGPYHQRHYKVVEPAKGGCIVGMLKARVPSFLMLLGCGLLLLASLAANAVLSVLGKLVSSNVPGGAILWQAVNFVVSLAIITLLFAMIFKLLPD